MKALTFTTWPQKAKLRRQKIPTSSESAKSKA